jgi:hypothetical protein
MLPPKRLERTRVGRYIEADHRKNVRAALNKRLSLRDGERQRRIAKYEQRAAQRVPLFA